MNRFLALLLSLSSLTACSLAPDYLRPDISLPAEWSMMDDDANAAPSKEVAIAQDWWTSFGSAELNHLIEQALAHNHDLQAGIHQVEQSRASLKIAGAGLLPTADASADASRSRTNPAQGNTTTGRTVQAGLNIGYELDLFGANRSRVIGAEANLKASQYDQDALKLVVMGDVASTYFTLINLRERLAIADTNLANAKEVLRISQARVTRGSESELELSQQASVVASREAAGEVLAQQVRNAENALAVLIGRAPQTTNFQTQSLDGLAIPAIASGQPSQLLERRPDLRAAEANLEAAGADIGVARAAFFPSITLGVGTSISATSFGDPATTALSLASSLTAPLFRGGELQGSLEQATARQKELVEVYRQTVLESFQEVEDALMGVKTAQARELALQVAMEQAQKAYLLAKRQYDAGFIDFQTLLNTQDSLLSAEDSFAQARLARLNAAIDLFKALGGGWSV